MNVTLRQLRLFLSVAKSGSFSRAGAEVGLTQSAVSRAVRELEIELGLRLFDRTTREVQLSAVGAEVQAHLPRLLDDLDVFLREVSEIGAQRRGRVMVAASPTIAARLMPPCVARCRERFPYVHLRLRDEVQSEVLRHVRSGEVDFGVVVGPFEADDLQIEALCEDSFVAILRDDDTLAVSGSLPWTGLAGRDVVLLDHSSGSRPLIDRALSDAGVQVDVVQDVANAATIFGLVEAGIGLGILPALALPLPAGMPLVALPIGPESRRAILRVRRRHRSLSPAAEAVWGVVGELLGVRATW
ncbi:LysR family transcriptional regulator [Chitinasiproducens palmae]|nr:LysR family transcriptional regulator [Chitinasiproducens palmae]